MDEIDFLTEREELAGPARIASSRKPIGPEANGECHNCEALVEPGIRWCSSECLFDWQKQQRADAQRPV